MTDEIDEFVLQMMRDYKDKEFKSVSSEDMTGEETEAQREEMKKAEEASRELLDYIKESLGDKVSEVKLSPRLRNSAVCLTTKGDISLEMEKVLNAMPTDQMVKANRILEINPNHPVMKTLQNTYAMGEEGKDMVKTYANLLYSQALLISGLTVENPIQLGEDICKVITK